MKQHWLQLTIHSPTPTEAEIIGDVLEQLGALAVTLQDAADHPLFEPELGTTPLWQHTKVTGLFAASADVETLLAQLSKQLASSSWDYLLESVDEKNWQTAWQKDFKPQCFADRLWIVPSWHTPPDKQGIHVILDPGLAFGTGSHPTTRLCLEWLAQQDLDQQIVIDYGCGSGILAIAAVKLGAKKVWAVDIDPQALEACRANAERNNISDSQLMTVLANDMPNIQCNYLVANILAKPLMELAPHFAQLCQPQANIALSGLLSEQADKMVEHYQPWFDLDVRRRLGEWMLLANTPITNIN